MPFGQLSNNGNKKIYVAHNKIIQRWFKSQIALSAVSTRFQSRFMADHPFAKNSILFIYCISEWVRPHYLKKVLEWALHEEGLPQMVLLTINLTQLIIYTVPLFKLIYPNTTTPLISYVIIPSSRAWSTHSNPGIFHGRLFEKESNSGLYNIYHHSHKVFSTIAYCNCTFIS